MSRSKRKFGDTEWSYWYLEVTDSLLPQGVPEDGTTGRGPQKKDSVQCTQAMPH